jgi:peptide/nickel transport system substrate-binding protein
VFGSFGYNLLDGPFLKGGAGYPQYTRVTHLISSVQQSIHNCDPFLCFGVFKEKKMANISRRQFLRVSAMAAAGAALTACQTAATPATTGGTGSEATQAPVAAGPTREKVWPMTNVPRNRTLVYSNGAMTPGLASPLVTGFNHQNGHAILWEPAAYYGAHADKTYLWLAESYQYNDDATEVTIKFRTGITWSDGTPFTANDVATSMERLKRVDGLNRSATYKAELEVAEVVDDMTLKVVLNQTDWRFFFKSLTFRFDLGDDTAILPDHIYKDIPDGELNSFTHFDPAKQWPVTTSAYGCSQATDQFTYFDLRPSWWAVESGFVEKEPDVWRLLQQPFQTDTLAAQQLINNEIDQSLDLRPLVVFSLMAQSDHVDTWTGSKPPFGYTDWWPISVYFNTLQAPTSDPKVRWAISYALNRQQLVDVGWGGAGKVSATPFPEFAKLDTMVAGIKDITDQYNILQQDLNKSANLMTEAGYAKNADGFWVDQDGNLPNFDLYAGVPLFGDLAPLIAEQLRAAGFRCEHKAPQDVWDAKADGRANLFLFGHGGATIDPWDTFMLYREENAMAVGSPSWGNLSRWSDPEFTAITDTMNNTAMDDPAMQQLFHDGMAIWYENLPDAPIVQWFHRIPINTTYWSNWPNAENPYMNSALWHQTMFIVLNGLKATNA